MATPITVSIPHQLGRAEARRRIDGGFAKMIQLLPGGARRSAADTVEPHALAKLHAEAQAVIRNTASG